MNTADAAEQQRYWQLHEERALAVLTIPEQRRFDVQEVGITTPGRARIHTSFLWENGGELTMETRIRRFEGRQLCIPCFERAETR